MSGGDDFVKPWQTLGEEAIYENRLLRLTRETVRLQNGRIVDDYFQIHMGQAAVIAATREDGRLILLRMYKHGARRSGIGFPGGGIEPGEAPLAAAQRELIEETGFSGGRWSGLGDYKVHSNQGCGHLYFFLAQGVVPTNVPSADDLEPHEFVYLDRAAGRDAIANQGFLSLGHVCLAALWMNATSQAGPR